jgi:hypothetical protein
MISGRKWEWREVMPHEDHHNMRGRCLLVRLTAAEPAQFSAMECYGGPTLPTPISEESIVFRTKCAVSHSPSSAEIRLIIFEKALRTVLQAKSKVFTVEHL